MSCKINIDLLSDESRKRIDNELSIRLENNKYSSGLVRYFHAHKIIGDDVYLPFAFAYSELKLKRPKRTDESKMSVKFEAELREEQKIVKKEAIEYLNKTGSVLISLYTGGGKTVTAINIGCTIKLKVLIVVNKIVLIKQWKDSIMQFCPTARVQCLTPKSELEDCDFYIMNAINIPKMGKDFFDKIKVLVVDEVHLIMAEKLSELTFYVQPRYMIGLSATAYRTDGFNVLLDLYFGKNKIIREINHKHIVYVVNTGFKPEMTFSENGKVNWSSVLDSQAKDEKRNEIILNIIKRFSDRVFLVLVKRVEHGEYLVKKLEEMGEYVTSLLGSNQEFDKEARILVGTGQKVGTGFDHPRLDALLLATDFEAYFMQFFGRVCRTKTVEPIVFDLLDDNGILLKHYKTRKEVYIGAGGKIKKYV